MIRFYYDPILDRVVQKVMLQELSKHIQKHIGKLHNDIRKKVVIAVRNSPTYIELASEGKLAGHMGLPAGQAAAIMEEILNTFCEDIHVNLVHDRLIIEVGLATFSKILALSSASHRIPWLDWLLLKGDRVLIDDAHIIFIPNAGRSKQAIMIKSDTQQNFWRVPPEHAGTIEDNFITKAIAQLVPEIILAIQGVLL